MSYSQRDFSAREKQASVGESTLFGFIVGVILAACVVLAFVELTA